MKVLIIDDDVHWIFILTRYLKKHRPDTKTYSANTGDTGIEIALKEIPDIILCDLAMPRGNGYDVARACKGNLYLRGTLILAVTGSKLIDGVTEAKAVGFDGLIDKAFDIEEAALQILRYCDERKL